MKNKSFKFVAGLALMFIFLFVYSNEVCAQSQAMRVGVSAIVPKNQIDKNQSFFDLLMKPGAEQTIEVNLSNNTDEDITMEVHANNGLTNDHGVVHYSQAENKENRDPSLKYSMTDISMVENEVIVPKQSNYKVPIKIKMPEESFKGVISGGIRITEKDKAENEEAETETGGVQIKNKTVYVVGAQFRTEESLEDMLPKLVLEPSKIKPKHVNYRNFLGINFQNTEPLFVRDLEIDAKIYRGNNDKPLKETKRQGLKMAPNSNFNFGVDWENKEFKAGKYRAKVKAYSSDYDLDWDWDVEFTIDSKDASRLNDLAVELDKDYLLYIIASVITLIVFLIIVLIVIGRIRKKKRKVYLRNLEREKSNSSNGIKSSSRKRTSPMKRKRKKKD